MNKKVEQIAKHRQKKRSTSLEEAAERDARLLEQYEDVEEPEGFASGDWSKIYDHENDKEDTEDADKQD